MRIAELNLLGWQERFGIEASCAQALSRQRWPQGFCCLRCGHDHGYGIATRHSHECTHCHYQASLTVGTLFHSTNLTLTPWLWAIYLTAPDKEGISAIRLSRQIDVSWITASRMLRKIRIAMGHRDSVYRLHELIEIDDTRVGGRHSGGKRGRGAGGKNPVLVAIENRDKRAGFMAMRQVSGVTRDRVAQFVRRHLVPRQWVRSDALPVLRDIGQTQHHAARVTPPAKAGEWLPWVHIAIDNLKAFLLGTYHGVSSKYLQEYLNEFCYRFNRREWEAQLPLRLLNACLTHTQIKLKMV
ncbi:MAG: IS1595 family transposase [Nitrosospira sp.]